MRNTSFLGLHRHISSRVFHRGTLRRSHRSAVVFLVICAFALSAYPATPDKGMSKPVWEWTVEERLLERFDATNVLDREFAARKTLERWGHLPDPLLPWNGRVRSYSIEGWRNPELFLPYELFDGLLSGFHSDQNLRTLQRGAIRDAIRLFGYDDEVFWSSLAKIAGPYLTHKYGPRHGFDRLSPYAKCRARYTALTEARQFFGADNFDRFLYTVIAPSTQDVLTTTDPDPARNLRFEESGCR
jgi:hypothetical protein